MFSGFQHSIAGGSGKLIIPALQSPNFIHGTSGWSINSDGTAEFHSVSLPSGAAGTVVTFAATAPAAPHTGDVWYNTANGLLVSVWGGSAWVSEQIGAAAIANGAVGPAELNSSVTARGLGGVTTTLGVTPPATGNVTGDLFVSSVTGQISQWSGSAWTPVTFNGSTVIQAGTITGATIAASTITGANIQGSTITGNLISSVNGGTLGAQGATLAPNPYMLNNDVTGWAAYSGTLTGTSSLPAGAPYPSAALAPSVAAPTVTVVQDQIITQNAGTWSGTFTNPVTAGNSVILIATSYAAPGTITSSAPTYNGAAVTGTVQLWSVNTETTGTTVYTTAWLLPHVPTSSSSVAVTISGGQAPSANPGAVGLWGLEISGLGASPTVGTAATAVNGNGLNPSSGPTAATSSAPGIVLGQAIGYGVPQTDPGSPWTAIPNLSQHFSSQGYQVFTSPGSSYTYSTTTSVANAWSAAACVVYATPTLQGVKTSAALPALPLYAYAISAWVYSATASTASVNFAWSGSTAFTSQPITPGAWSFVQAAATSPSGTTSLTPEITVSGGSFYVTGYVVQPQVPGTLIQGNSISTGQIAANIGITSPTITGGTITGGQLIGDGAGKEVLIYTGTAAAGNLYGSISATNTTDAYGNTVRDGFVSYAPGVGSTGYVQIADSQGTGEPFVILGPNGVSGTGVTTLADPFQLGSITNNSGTTTEQYFGFVLGPIAAARPDAGKIYLFSSSTDGTTDAAGIQFLYDDPAGTNHIYQSIDYSGVRVFAAQPIAAVQPGTGTSPTNVAVAEAWHNMTLLNGWTVLSGGVARYKKMPDNSVWIQANLSAGTGTSGTAIWTAPTGYIPATAAHLDLVGGNTSATGLGAYVTVATGGSATISTYATLTSGSGLYINGFYPLD